MNPAKRQHVKINDLIFSYLIISFTLAVAKSGCATNRWRKSVFSGCRQRGKITENY